jgi:hypothetical protein
MNTISIAEALLKLRSGVRTETDPFMAAISLQSTQKSEWARA